MEPLLAQISESVASARTLEELTRPMLEMLEAVTGCESTYLTTIDEDAGQQHILISRNASEAMCIPEGLTVPWNDTLCKRALDEGKPYTCGVPDCWGDSEAARALGIQTYMSTPVRTDDGVLYGTLCAASAQDVPMSSNTEHVLRLFARLIGQHVERERLLADLRTANAELAASAATDALTGLPNRRALIAELRRMMAAAARERRSVLVAFADLDGFKRINDTHGHDTGDAFLRAMAERLLGAVRAGEMLSRFGGDEFVLIAPGPPLSDGDAAPGDIATARQAAHALAERLAAATRGQVALHDADGAPLAGPAANATADRASAIDTIDYAGASVGAVPVDPRATDADTALRRADAAMYEVKRERQAGRG